MKKVVLTAALLLALNFPNAANALTIDVGLGDMSGDVSYSTGGTITPNINLLTVGSELTRVHAAILPAGFNATNFVLSPTGGLYGHTYLAVLGGGSATFNLAPNQDAFGFTWGTVDAYNSVTLTDAKHDTFTISGATILADDPALVPGKGEINILFTDPFAAITSVELLSSRNSLEAGNFVSQSAVPLPGTFPLFGAGLLGLAIFALRRNQKAI